MNVPGKPPKVTGYAYVIASTLNQMVNYIPLKMEIEGVKLGNIYNVTLKKENKADGRSEKLEENEDWDKNFSSVVTEVVIKDIEIEQDDWLNVVNTVKAIKNAIKNEDKPIFWNVTGGQRPFLMAVWEIIKDRPKDIVVYLEGNSRKMVFTHGKNRHPKLYAIEGLTIQTALQLMGFNTTDTLLLNILDQPGEKKRLNHFYSRFCPKYLSDPDLRKCMPGFNDKNSGEANFNFIIDNKFPEISGLTKEEIKTQWDEYKCRKAFGYILEEMLLYFLLKSIEENNLEEQIAALYPSTKVTAGYFNSNKTIDEFDALILTKTGQVISFEAKSGGMSGDVAKSTNYSTYAISGVYGKPILITPQINAYDSIHNKITNTIKAANRANLKIWFLKEIEEKLVKKLTK